MREVREKLTHEIPVRVTQEMERYVKRRSEQLGLESRADLIRGLIEKDKEQAEREFSLMAEALGVQVIRENNENTK